MKSNVKPTSDDMRLKAKSAALRFAEERDIETDGRHLIDTLLFDQPCYVAWEGEATAIIFYDTDPGTAVTIMNRPGRLATALILVPIVPADVVQTTQPEQELK